MRDQQRQDKTIQQHTIQTKTRQNKKRQSKTRPDTLPQYNARTYIIRQDKAVQYKTR